jgi:hypothetical protein
MRLASILLCLLPTGAASQELAFAKGSLGEPFTVAGLVQGCTTEGEAPGCSFYAEGWRWMAIQGSGTPDAVLEAMASLPVNAPAVFHGDVLNQGDIIMEVALALVEPGGADADADLRAAVQGDWVSSDDPMAAISVVGSEWSNLYDGQLIDQNVMTLGATCPDASDGQSPGIVLQMMGGAPEDMTCFGVMDISAGNLTLLHLPRGNVLSYVRP